MYVQRNNEGRSATIVAVEKQQALHTPFVCRLRNQTNDTHAPYCHLWPVWFYHIFPHYLITARFRKKVSEQKMFVLIFSTTFF